MSSSSSSGRGNFPLTFILQLQGADQVNTQFNQVKNNLNGTTSATTPLNKELGQTQKQMTAVGTAGESLGSKVGKAQQPINKTASAGDKLSKSQPQVAKTTDSAASKFQRSRRLIFGVSMFATGMFEAVGMYQGLMDTQAKESSAQKELNDVIAGGVENTKAYQKAVIARNEAQAKLNELQKAGKTDTAQYRKEQAKLKQAEEDINKIREEGIEGSKEYKDANDDVADAQKGLRFMLRNTILSFTDLIPLTLLTVTGFANLSASTLAASAAEASAGGITKATTAMEAMRVAMIALPLRVLVLHCSQSEIILLGLGMHLMN